MSRNILHTAFLVRWQEDQEHARWRSSIENAYTGEKFYFTDKTELLRFLSQLLLGIPPDTPPQNEFDKPKK